MQRKTTQVRRKGLLACALLAAACSSETPEPPIPVPAAGPEVVAVPKVAALLVDSTAWAREDADGVLYRVAVRTATTVDTLDGVWTTNIPLLVGDSMFVGFGHSEDWMNSLYRYHAGSGQPVVTPLPDDASFHSGATVSPDGRYLAYVVHSAAYAHGKVVTIPDYKVIGITDSVAVPAGDYFSHSTAFTSTSDALLCIDLTDGWFRSKVSVSPWRTVADTVRTDTCQDAPTVHEVYARTLYAYPTPWNVTG